MKRLILLASLAVLLLEVHGAAKYQILMNDKRKDSFSEENTNEQLNLGPKAIEQSEKDNTLTESMDRLELFRDWEKNQDLLRHFRSPMQLPEEDRDYFYHPRSMEDNIKESKILEVFHHDVLQGPEEDRDKFFHAED
ncbi:proline-rich acidic protein 1 [Sminthopsis crassicaudata]|uniref:proline-rich acidic protein 1 n=1 Tax=Sminthopsis crassicaudata TaxID=9301 RepID=UPI003D69DA5D